MTKRKKELNLVIDLLKREYQNLNTQIKDEQGVSKHNIELKEQLKDAIANLKLCSKHGLFANEVSVIEIPEGGSEAYFTGFKLVDESGMDNVPDWAIKKVENKDVELHCFDLIIKK